MGVTHSWITGVRGLPFLALRCPRLSSQCHAPETGTQSLKRRKRACASSFYLGLYVQNKPGSQPEARIPGPTAPEGQREVRPLRALGSGLGGSPVGHSPLTSEAPRRALRGPAAGPGCTGLRSP